MTRILAFTATVLWASQITLAGDPEPPAQLLWQPNGETIDLMIRLNQWREGLEGYNVNRRIVGADGQKGDWLLLNEVEPLTPYAAPDKDLSNIEVDPDELTKLEAYNREQAGKLLRTTTKEQGWEEMTKPDPDNRMMRMLNYFCRKDFRTAKLIGLGMTDRQVPRLADGEKLEYALFAVVKGEQTDAVHSVQAVLGQDIVWPTDFHFNVERRKFAKDSILRFSWLPEQVEAHNVTGFRTFCRAKGSDDEFIPTSPQTHPKPRTGEFQAFHKWTDEESQYEYALACVNAFGTHGPLLPEGTSTDKFNVEDGPTIKPGVKLGNHYSKTFSIAKLREPDTKLRTSSMTKKTNGIGTVKSEFVIHVREGKNYLVISHEANLEKVDLKCSVKTLNQQEPLITAEQMKTKIMKGKLYHFAELPLEDDETFAVVTEIWTK